MPHLSPDRRDTAIDNRATQWHFDANCMKMDRAVLLSEFVKCWPTFGAFARAVGVPYATAGAWLQRNSISKGYLRAVARAARENGLDITVEDILEMEEASAKAARRQKKRPAAPTEVRAA